MEIEVCGELDLFGKDVDMATWTAEELFRLVAPVAGGDALGDGMLLCMKVAGLLIRNRSSTRKLECAVNAEWKVGGKERAAEGRRKFGYIAGGAITLGNIIAPFLKKMTARNSRATTLTAMACVY